MAILTPNPPWWWSDWTLVLVQVRMTVSWLLGSGSPLSQCTLHKSELKFVNLLSDQKSSYSVVQRNATCFSVNSKPLWMKFLSDFRCSHFLISNHKVHNIAECDVPVPGIFIFLWYRNRYRKNLVPELIFVAKMFVFRTFIMGTGTGTGNFSFFLVVSEPVSEKFGTGKKSRNRYR